MLKHTVVFAFMVGWLNTGFLSNEYETFGEKNEKKFFYTTFDNGSLGSRNDEERSELR